MKDLKFILGILCAIACADLAKAGVEIGADQQKSDAWQDADSFVKRLDQATLGSDPIDPRNPPTFAVWLLSFGSGQLIVLADYFNLTNTEVVLHGRKIIDPVGDARRFYPYASLEVSDQKDRDWRVIGTSPEPGKGVEAAAVMAPIKIGVAEPNPEREACVTDMNPFRAFVGKFRYGRVVLKDGGTSQVIVLTDLLPPKK